MKSRQKGKKKGSSKERVFGCDLQEHLQHSGQEGKEAGSASAGWVGRHWVSAARCSLKGRSSFRFSWGRGSGLGSPFKRPVSGQDRKCVSVKKAGRLPCVTFWGWGG